MADNYRFDIPTHHKSIIKVMGVGGGGSNAVNHMFNEGIEGVEFVVCNTDNQVLIKSPVPTKLPIGQGLSEGLGAGGDPEFGEKAALESKDEIRELLAEGGTKMLFITAGMGGGTGTGAAPVIAQIANELDILTVGILTFPFSHEGPHKKNRAVEGLDKMKEYCDTVLVISNDKLEEVYGELDFFNAFAQADEVLTVAAKSIAELITKEGVQNVDFQDVKNVMKNGGPALMGSASASGDNRGVRAAQDALTSPLLENTDISGAKKILVSVSVDPSSGFTMTEFKEIMQHVRDSAGEGADLKFGVFQESDLGEKIQITVIATGFEDDQAIDENTKKVYDLDSNKQIDTRVDDVVVSDASAFAKSSTQNDRYQTSINQPIQNSQQQQQQFQNEQYQNGVPSQHPVKPVNPPEEKVVYNLDDEFEIEETTSEDRQDPSARSRNQSSSSQYQQYQQGLEEKRRALEQQNNDRIDRIKNVGNSHLDEGMDDFRTKLNTPAYLRRNVKIENSPQSSDKEISRFNLDDENDIMGNNRFLHDNVD
jgi:cell division protein FtsZ